MRTGLKTHKLQIKSPPSPTSCRRRTRFRRARKGDQDDAMGSPAASSGPRAHTPRPREGGIPRGTALTHFQGRSTAATRIPFARTEPYFQAVASTLSARRCPNPGPAAVFKCFCRGRRRLHSPAAWPPGTLNPATAPHCPASLRARPGTGLYFLLDSGRREGRGPKWVATPLPRRANRLEPSHRPAPAPPSGAGRGCVRPGSLGWAAVGQGIVTPGLSLPLGPWTLGCHTSREPNEPPVDWSAGRVAGRAHRKILWFSGLPLILEAEPGFSSSWSLRASLRYPPTSFRPPGSAPPSGLLPRV